MMSSNLIYSGTSPDSSAQRQTCRDVVKGPIVLRDVTPESRLESVGGKAFNLARMSHHDLPVPPWFCVTTQLFEGMLRISEPALPLALDTVIGSELERLKLIGDRLRKRIASWPLPELAQTEILDEYDRLTRGNTALVAVRSSIVGEDSAEHSFAGLMDSYLGVTRAELLDRIKRCWASAYSDRALAYRLRRGIPADSVRAAVIVQLMIPAVRSGVLFTRDPTPGSPDQFVICAGFGLGDGVVSDRVACDTYRVSRKSKRIDREVTEKSSRIVLDRSGGTTIEPVEARRRQAPVLENSELRQLVQFGRRLEALFGSPQDVEWSYGPDGSLHLLQCRPIVQLRRDAIAVWDNSNIAESYPGVTTPLTYSFVREVYEEVFRETLHGFGVDPSHIEAQEANLSAMVGYLKGRIYYNLINWYNVVSSLLGAEKNREALETVIGVRERVAGDSEIAAALKPVARTLSSRLRVIASTGQLALTVRGRVERYLTAVDAALSDYRAVDYEHASPHELMELFFELKRRFLGRAALTNFNDFFAMKFFTALQDDIERWGPSDRSNLQNDLLRGSKCLESIEPLRSLDRIAGAIRQNSAARRLFDSSDAVEIWQVVQRDGSLDEIRQLMVEHLERYGDRSLGELKLETPRLSDDPQLFISLLQDHVVSGRSLETSGDNDQRTREAEEALRRSLRGHPLRRRRIEWLLDRTRLHLELRESLRFARSRLFGVVKSIFRALGERLAQVQVILRPDDVFFLEVDEIFDAVRGTSTVDNLGSLVGIRRAAFEQWRRAVLPARVVTRGAAQADLDRVLVEQPDNGACTQTGNETNHAVIQGVGCSPGRVRGRARVVVDPSTERRIDGDILVTRSTDPGWIFLMMAAGGIVVEKGGMLSHAAIIGRELGVPMVIGAAGAIERIRSGQQIELDGERGRVSLLD